MDVGLEVDTNDFALPIKVNKKVVYRDELSLDNSQSIDDQSPGNSKPLVKENYSSVLKSRKEKFDSDVARIGSLCTHILSQDDYHLTGLNALLEFFDDNKMHSNCKITKIVLTALIELFRKIMPENRIRPPSEKELNQQMKAETKREFLRNKSLIENYGKFIKILFLFAKNKNNNDKIKDECYFFKSKSIEGMCVLLETNSSFNFHDKLIKYLTRILARSNNIVISERVFSVLADILENDISFENAFEIVQTISNTAIKQNFEIKSILFELIFKFNLEFYAKQCRELTLNSSNEIKTEKSKLSKKKIKAAKKVMKVKKELEIANAKLDYTKNSKIIQRITETVFFLFFKCLKDSRDEKLLSFSFKGISLYSHLLNIDFFTEIIQLYKSFLINTTLSICSKLVCLNSFFILIKYYESSLLIDYSFFYNYFIQLLTDIDFSSPEQVSLVESISQEGFVEYLQHLKKPILVEFTLSIYNIVFLQIEHNGALKNILKYLIDNAELEELFFFTDENSIPCYSYDNTLNTTHSFAWSKALLYKTF